MIALHCSGAGAGQWTYLAEALGGGYQLLAPEHFGNESAGPWTGERAFTLADEAARSIALIDECEGGIHLVGHSYGGGVALHVALARPERIASMALYEPSAFHLLRQMSGSGVEAFAEITSIVRRTCKGIVTGDYRGAALAFVDYWNGPARGCAAAGGAGGVDTWSPKRSTSALIRNYAGQVLSRIGLPGAFARRHAPADPRDCRGPLTPVACEPAVDGRGRSHGPLTHAPEVAALIVRHIVDAAADAPPWRWRPQGLAGIPGAAARPAEAVS